MEQTPLYAAAFIPITTTYAAILALMMVALASWVILGRAQTGVSIGDDGQELLKRRTRAFGNFAEYVPMCVIIMFVIENASGQPVFLHALGITLIVGRLAHAFGIHPERPMAILRVAGAALTLLVLGGGALYALKLVLPGI